MRAAFGGDQSVLTFLPAARAQRKRELLTGYLLCLPAFLLVFALLVYPFVYDLQLSFTDAHDFEGSGRFIGLSNYVQLAQDSLYWISARNTVALVLVTAAVELLVGVLTAMLLWWRFWGRAIIFLAVFVPWAFPSAFSAFAWYWLLLPPFHSFYTLDALSARFWLEGIFGSGAWQVLSIGIMSIWRGSSIIAIFLLAGLNAIPAELLDYGRLESRSPIRYFYGVLVPLTWRFLVLAVLIALVITYIDYTSMYIESGARIIVPELGTLVFTTGIVGGRTGLAAAVTVTQLPVAVALVLIGLHFVERQPARRRPTPAGDTWRVEAVATASRGPTPMRRRSSHSWRRWKRELAGLGGLAAVAVFVFHVFPLYYTAIQAVRPLDEYHLGQIFWAFHPDTDSIAGALSNPTYWRWARNTLVVFGIALVGGITSALLAGYGLARFQLRGSRWLARCMFATYFLPQLAVVLPVFQLYNALRLDNTLLGNALLYLTLTVPFGTWLFYSYYLGLDREVEEQAWIDAGRLQAFWYIVIPMSWPVIIAVALFSVGMMGSDVLYGALFSLTNDTKTLPTGLGLTAIDLGEWANVNAAILLASLPLVVSCAALGRYYVSGLQAALVEGA